LNIESTLLQRDQEKPLEEILVTVKNKSPKLKIIICYNKQRLDFVWLLFEGNV